MHGGGLAEIIFSVRWREKMMGGGDRIGKKET